MLQGKDATMQDNTENLPVQKPTHLQMLRAAMVVGGLLAGAALALLVFRPESLPRLEQEIEFLVSNPFGSGQVASRADDTGPLTVGQPAPDFTLKTLAGDEITLSDLRGQSVLINFWASWCGPCRREMPEMLRVYEKYKEEGFTILAVNLTHQDALPEVEAFVEEFQMPFPVPLDETGEVTTDLYRLRGIPTSVFVDRAGVVQRVYIGAMSGDQLDQFVAEIL